MTFQPWKIPESEYKSRRDVRGIRVFSIDPATARDLDDALSIEPLGNGLYRVGVHIADVSYFVNPGNALDREAEYRATTVYLVQKAIPMLPRVLCEELCSLNPGVERLSFSVFWVMDDEAVIQGQPEFARSIMKSCVKMSYEHAQTMIEMPDDTTDFSAYPNLLSLNITNGYTLEDIKNDVKLYYKLSLKLRQRRFDDGALTMQNLKMWFALDENGNPNECGPYILKDSNRLIEEVILIFVIVISHFQFMLLANMAVAKKISMTYPECALLRRHGEPQANSLAEFIKQAESLGFHGLDVSSSSALQKSFEKIEDPHVQSLLRHLCVRSMQRAQYFCSGMEDIMDYWHYALSCPIYTHFTSPIRRYCDVIVHRLLDCALKDVPADKIEEQLGVSTYRVADIAKWCNMRKEMSKTAQDASQNLYLCAYLRALMTMNEKDVIEEAFVYQVGSRSVDVLVPRYGLDKRLFVEDLLDLGVVQGSSFDEEVQNLKIHWAPKGDVPKTIKEYKVFDRVFVKMEPQFKQSPPTVKCYLMHPSYKPDISAASNLEDAQGVIAMGPVDEAD